MQKLTIEDVKAVKFLEMEFPDGGGLVLLRGVNGSGKSQSLAAVAAAVGPKELRKGLEARDGRKTGHVRGFGVTLTIGGTTRLTGEPEIVSLDSRLRIDRLVDPKIKDPIAADQHRIKALIGLTGEAGSPEWFERFGGELTSELSQDAREETDLVEQARKIRAELNKAALAREGVADREEGYARAKRDATAGITIPEHDPDASALEAAFVEAKNRKTRLEERQRIAEENAVTVKGQKAALELTIANYRGPGEKEAAAAFNAAAARVDEVKNRLAAADRAVFEAQEVLRKAEADRQAIETTEMPLAAETLETARARLDAATGHVRHVEQLKQSIESSLVPTVSPEEFEAVDAAIDQAREAVEHARRVRQARADAAEAERHFREARIAREHAAAMREQAKATDNVLSEAVACETLRVENGRLVTDTARANGELFADLSEGQRWRIAVDLGADRVGEGGCLVIPQEAFESLDPKNVVAIIKRARERGVYIVAAECDGGPLRSIAITKPEDLLANPPIGFRELLAS